MIKKKSRKLLRKKRHNRVRKKIYGTKNRPRLAVFKSNKYLSVQIINDEKGHTLASATTQTMDIKNKHSVDAAKKLGEQIAKLAKEKKVESVVFDRGGYLYHGKVKALAEAAKNKGLKI